MARSGEELDLGGRGGGCILLDPLHPPRFPAGVDHAENEF
jgi:hypothetical protein